MTTSNVVRVKNCPSPDKMTDAMKLRFKVSFTLEDGRVIDAFVNGMEIVNGDPALWIVKLYDPKETLGLPHLHGYLDTKPRRGHLEPYDVSLAA